MPDAVCVEDPEEMRVLFRSRKPRIPEGQRLGFRSTFVLAKLGHELREQYADLLNAPLPKEIERPLERLRGSRAEVESLDEPRRR
ncbi:MAG TPA: hypothetical protein VGU24_21665 [Microvirga sp.]|nr:hypothetical protein [Microvirga sp.]